MQRQYGLHENSKNMEYPVTQLKENDLPLWLPLRKALWPHHPADIHTKEMAVYFANPETMAVFLAWDPQEKAIGFIEITLRSIAEGCPSGSNIGYIEGWYVQPAYQQQGYGKQLVYRAEQWAQNKGCTIMASDTDIDNHQSITAHSRSGYREIKRLVHFIKPLA